MIKILSTVNVGYSFSCTPQRIDIVGPDTLRHRHAGSTLQLTPFRDGLDSCSGERVHV